MPDVFVELADGSYLVLDGDDGSRRVREELDVWALVPEDGESGATRDPSVWHDALQAGPLLYVVFTGVVGNAAWEVFPASASWLSSLFGRRRQLDAPGAAKRAAEAAAEVTGVADEDVSASGASKDGEGVWHIELALSDGRQGKARIDASGNVTHVKFR